MHINLISYVSLLFMTCIQAIAIVTRCKSCSDEILFPEYASSIPHLEVLTF
jgi:hypothetical protein